MANEVTVPLLPCPSIDEIVSLAELRAIPLTDADRAQVADTLAAAEDLA